ncbi:MAG: hypothetical protein C0448_06950 [Sphingobacteriaceae bacterium]|nr:hypothetical protein [Sphingobacteriaceae bacterium]
MIKIELDHNRNFKSLDEFSQAYYLLVKPTIIKKASDLHAICCFIFDDTPLDFATIDGRRKEKYISLLSNKKIDFKKNDTDTKLKRLLKKTIYHSYPTKGKGNILYLFEELLSFLQDTKNIRGINLKNVITEKPTSLENYNTILMTYFSKLFAEKRIKPIVHYILDYSVIHDNSKIRNLYLENLNVKVCPYCNRNYVSFIEHDSSKVIGPTMDHFLSKTNHPLLAASFYNLIPSCYVCNSNIKGDQQTKIEYNLNPFIDGFGETAKFILKSKNKPYQVKLKIDYRKPNAEKVLSSSIPPKEKTLKGNALLFKLNEIYQNAHSDEVNLLMAACDNIESAYSSSIKNILKKHANISEFYKFYFQKFSNEKDYSKIPLSKLTKDLVDDRLPWL